MIGALLFSALGVVACAAPDDGSIGTQEVAPLATGEAQTRRLCSRDRSDIVLDVFCSDEPPRIETLLDLRAALGINKPAYEQGLAVISHSTALTGRTVSSINPRLIFINPPGEAGGELLMLAFARGEQSAEIVVRDRARGDFQFYLVSYEQACNEVGCTPGDLLTETAEVGWKNLNVYAEEDLANTPRDCRTCHQPNGPGTTKLLRMQELEPPWNHWLYPFVPGGRALIADYRAAKEGELFGGLSAAEVADRSNPGLLSATLHFANTVDQPNAYVSAAIGAEVIESAAALGGKQPEDNSIPGESETWDAIYEKARNGEAISVPYHDVKVTDPAKLAAMTAAYVDYLEGRLAREDLPDIREIFPDDPMLRARMGLETEPGMSGEEVLMQACAQCHNDRLDQSLSRARFNVNIGRLSAEEKARAVARVSLPVDDPAVMPPAMFRHLRDDAKQKLIELLGR